MEGEVIPPMTFYFREGDTPPEGGVCPIGGKFVEKTTDDIFGRKRVVVFSLPGAYTPTCSTYQVPGFEAAYEEMLSLGVDDVYVSAVNDGFVMNAWADIMGLKNVKVLPDGNGYFCGALGKYADFSHLGFGMRSKRFAAVITNGVVEAWFPEPDATADDPDPYGESSPEKVLEFLNIPEGAL